MNVLEIKSLPSDWKLVELDEVVKFQGGSQPPKSVFEYEKTEDNIRLVQIRDFRTDKYITYIPIKQAKRFFDKDDIMIGRYGPPVFQILRGLSGSFNVALMKAIPKDNLDRNYLFYLLQTDKIQNYIVSNSQRTAGQTGVNLDLLNAIQIPLPPLAEQKRIAEVLDCADALRRKRRRALEKLDTLLQSVFLEMFGDPVKNPMGWKSSQLGSECGVGSSKRVFVDELVETGIPFYRGTEIGKLGDNQFVNPSLFITKEHYERLKGETGVPQIGDLLMPSICPDGRIYLVKDENPFYFKDGRVLWIKLDNSDINSVFLRYHLKQLFFANYSKIASGTTFAELKIFALKDLDIQVPPVELQDKFSKVVDKIETIKENKQNSLDRLENLFQSLQQKAFKGELFKNESVPPAAPPMKIYGGKPRFFSEKFSARISRQIKGL